MIINKVMMNARKNIKDALSLSHFIRRQKTLDLYRQYLRLIYQIENGQQRQDTLRWIRSEFQSKAQTKDKELIEMYLTNGKNSLRDLEASLRHAHALKQPSS